MTRVEVPILTVEQFLREMRNYRDAHHMMFLGAGASVTSGMPSAAKCVEDWKRQIFESHYPGKLASRSEVESWFQRPARYPGLDSPEEYAFYAEECYSSAWSRRQYFNKYCQSSVPSIGYRMLALLAKAEILKAIWTTNFDDLAIKAAAAVSHTVREVCLDTASRVRPPFRPKELLHVALHGDYRYDSLKNLEAESKRQDETLRKALRRRAEDYPLIVIGYSGRDNSVMEMLSEVYRQQTNGPLYWCGMNDSPTAHIATLLGEAVKHGNPAVYVPNSTFDDTLCRLALHCLEGDLLDAAKDLLTKPLKPRPVIKRNTAESLSSLYLAAVLITRAGRNGAGDAPGTLDQINALPSLRIDPESLSADRNDRIFRAWLKQNSSSEVEKWCRVGFSTDSSRVVWLEKRACEFGGVNLVRLSLDIVGVFGSSLGQIVDFGQISA